MRTRPLAAAVLAGCLLAVAGCGGGSSSNDEQTSATVSWANGVCQAVTAWRGSTQAAIDSVKQGSVSQDSLKSAADSVGSATDTLTKDLRDLGKPDTQSGTQAQAAIDSLSDQVSKSRETIQQAVDGASGVSGTLSAASTVTSTLATLGDSFKSLVGTLKSLDTTGELQTAFGKAESCDSLRST